MILNFLVFRLIREQREKISVISRFFTCEFSISFYLNYPKVVILNSQTVGVFLYNAENKTRSKERKIVKLCIIDVLSYVAQNKENFLL